MDLLQDNNNKKKKQSTGQKVVLTLLIISIVLCLIIVLAIAYLSSQGENKAYAISINGKKTAQENLKLFTTENGDKYISLRLLCNELGYNYKNGEFKIPGEDQKQGYIDNEMNIIQFFADSKKIYKTKEDSNTDYEYYDIQKPIIQGDDSLYISLDDLPKAMNLIVSYSQKNNETIIMSGEYLIAQTAENLKTENITISDNVENIKALSYNYRIINKDGKYGVTNLNGEEIIGNKYNNITFCEYTGDFIVSNTNDKFGIITKDSTTKVNLQYDSIEILNYNPLLYKVEKLDKYGIMTEEGKIINEIEYDSIGYPENKEREINYTLIVPELNENIPESIVVCKDGKYGLIELETGETIIDTNLKGIYSATDDEQVYYIVETETQKAFLENYVDSLNKITVNVQH